MWSNIEINNDIYIISITQKDNAINIFLTNLIEIWMETLTHNIILQRCKALNPLLNVEAINCYEIVLGILNNISAHIVEASTEQIKLKVSIEGGSMKFALNLLIGKPKDFWENITKPLCISSMEIVRQHEFLLDLIKKKDEEIAEYKAEGAELIRKNIETKRFTEEQLKINSPSLNTFDYTNAFQRIINFYNIFNLDKYDKTSVEVPSTSNDNDKMVKTEQNINIPIEDNDKSVDKDISMQEKVKALNSKNESQNESKLSKEVANQKTRTADMVCRPFKKLKKRFV
ncbi:Non-homologous end-joining factor 1 [Anthophora quadrimaculata]